MDALPHCKDASLAQTVDTSITSVHWNVSSEYEHNYSKQVIVWLQVPKMVYLAFGVILERLRVSSIAITWSWYLSGTRMGL
jgi:hypothetical protein